MGTLWQDVRYGLRGLRKSAMFTAIAVLTIALGIGANTAIFSVVYSVLLNPLPYPEPERLVWWWEVQPELPTAPFSAPDFLDYQSQQQTFEHVAAIRSLSFNLTGAGDAQRLRGNVVTPNFLGMLGVRPAMGRDFTAEDAVPGAPRVALLVDGFWKRHFGGVQDVLGKTLALNDEVVTVVGVLPASYAGPRGVDFFVNPKKGVPELAPNFSRDERQMRGMHYMAVMGRLKRGVTLARAQADIDTIAARLQKQYESNRNHSVRLVAYHEYVTGDVRSSLLALQVAVALLLLIACVNVAHLLLARATTRQREMAIRVALGAGGRRLAAQLLTESVLLGLAGGTLGLVLGIAGKDLLVTFSGELLPRSSEVKFSLPILGFTFGLSLLTGMIFGMAPAFTARRAAIADVLKEGARSVIGGRRRQREALLMAEVAIALVMLAGSGLLLKSFVKLLEVRPGFDPGNLTTAWVSLSGKRNLGTWEFVSRVQERLESAPGVRAVAFCNDLPLEGQDTSGSPTMEGQPPDPPGQEILVGQHIVNPGYFKAMGIPLVKGREFTVQDTSATPAVVIVNQKFARRYWPNEDPIGKRFRLFRGDEKSWETVVGVVGDVLHNGLSAGPSLEAYAPIAQNPWGAASVAIRAEGGPETVVPLLRAAVREVDANVPVFGVRTMETVAADTILQRRVLLGLTSAFAGLALVLAAVGIYGVTSYAVGERTHEIGIRMALGAQRSEIFRLVLSRGLGTVLAGIVVGAGLALGMTRFLKAFLFRVEPNDPFTMILVPIVLVGVAALACYLPARRAMRIDPLVALRYE